MLIGLIDCAVVIRVYLFWGNEELKDSQASAVRCVKLGAHILDAGLEVFLVMVLCECICVELYCDALVEPIDFLLLPTGIFKQVTYPSDSSKYIFRQCPHYLRFSYPCHFVLL